MSLHRCIKTFLLNTTTPSFCDTDASSSPKLIFQGWITGYFGMIKHPSGTDESWFWQVHTFCGLLREVLAKCHFQRSLSSWRILSKPTTSTERFSCDLLQYFITVIPELPPIRQFCPANNSQDILKWLWLLSTQ